MAYYQFNNLQTPHLLTPLHSQNQPASASFQSRCQTVFRSLQGSSRACGHQFQPATRCVPTASSLQQQQQNQQVTSLRTPLCNDSNINVSHIRKTAAAACRSASRSRLRRYASNNSSLQEAAQKLSDNVKEAAGEVRDGVKESGESASRKAAQARDAFLKSGTGDPASALAGKLTGAKEAMRGAVQQGGRQLIEMVDGVPLPQLPVAVQMGYYSFEAYNVPEDVVGLPEGSPNGAQTVYMDRSFLQATIKGVAEVHVRRAVGLRVPEGVNSKPYAVVSIGSSSGLTTAVDNDPVNPQWRETNFLYVRDLEEEEVLVEVLNQDDPAAEDNPLGSARAELAALCDGADHSLTLDLRSGGTVEVDFHFQPFSDDLLDNVLHQAVGQMITDDWREAAVEEWYDDSREDWRYTANPLQEEPRLAQEGGAALAQGTAVDREEFQAWSELVSSIVERQLVFHAEPLAFVANQETDTEAWVYWNTDKRDIVIAFRGTSSPKDMMTDMSMELSAFSPGKRAGSEDPESVDLSDNNEQLKPIMEKLQALETFISKLTNGKFKGTAVSTWLKGQAQMFYAAEHDEKWVHKGFLDSYNGVRDRLLAVVQQVLRHDAGRGDREQEPWRIFTTGHSMGGALATLCAYDVISQEWGSEVPRPEVAMYAFGSPRTGNAPFAQDFDNLVLHAWRMSNENDIVTKVPSLLGYRHVGIEVRLFDDGTVEVCRGSKDDIRETMAMSDILPKIKEGVFGEDEEAKKEFQDVLSTEWENAQKLIKGDAINAHMEDFYCNAMKACVKAGGDDCQIVVKENCGDHDDDGDKDNEGANSRKEREADEKGDTN